MLGKVNVGILGTGNIASVMAATIESMKGVKLYAVASREKVKADIFAGKHGCKKAYGSYEELAADKKVDLIYTGDRRGTETMWLAKGWSNFFCRSLFQPTSQMSQAWLLCEFPWGK